ncbi:hypothetical protein [Candidatus Foliamicus sp.]
MKARFFDADRWSERLAGALAALARGQEPYLQEYWRTYPRKRQIVGGRDETLFPLDDLRMVYADARRCGRLDKEAEYAPLCALLDPARYALLSHPKLERIVASGRNIGENDFWMQLVNSGVSVSAGDLIAGLMARAAECSGDGFRAAALELNAFLSPIGHEGAAEVLRDLDEGCDALLFYGLTVRERIEIGNGMAILPYGEVRRFVGREPIEKLAPQGAGFHEWRSVGAVITPFQWRPVFRLTGNLNEPVRCPPADFFPDARKFLDLLAVSHEAAVLPIAKIPNCIDSSAARLFGMESDGPGAHKTGMADRFDGFAECPELNPSAFDEAREAFGNSGSEAYGRLGPFVVRLAEALGRDGRLGMGDKIVDVVIALEGMFDLPKWKKRRKLEARVSGFLGADADDKQKISEAVGNLYNARSDIVHSGSSEASSFKNGAAFVTGFTLARRSLFKLLREGTPENWDELATADE